MASRDRDRATSGLLRRSLARPAGAPGAEGDCPAPDILAAYYERSLDAAEAARCDLHFSQCARCRDELATLARADESATARDESPQARAGWVWLWDWRWLAPAAAALAIVIVWVAQRPAPTRIAEQEPPAPLVALSRPSEPPVSSRTREPLPQAKIAIPRASSTAEPAERTAPTSSLEAVRSAPPRQLPAPAPGKESAENVPLGGRDYMHLDALTKAEEAPKRAAAQGIVAGTAEPNISAGAPQSAPSAAPVLPPAAPSAAERVVVTSEQATVQTEPSAGALTAKQMAESKPANARQSAASPVVRNYAVQTQAVAVQNDEGRSAETLIRTPDASVLWRLARGGFVERSLDGGATWHGQAPGANAQLAAGSAPTAKICWLVGRNGLILLTKDGMKWKTIPPPAAADFIAVAARDASSATVTAADGRKFSTGDSGKHWNALP